MPHKDPIAAKEYFKSYNNKRKESTSAYCKKRHALNRESILKKQKAARAEHPEISDAGSCNSRAKKHNQPGRVSPEQILTILDSQDRRCKLCSLSFVRIGSFKGYHIDHIRPLTANGSNDCGNIQALCETCNRKKYNKGPEEIEKKLALGHFDPSWTSCAMKGYFARKAKAASGSIQLP